MEDYGRLLHTVCKSYGIQRVMDKESIRRKSERPEDKGNQNTTLS